MTVNCQKYPSRYVKVFFKNIAQPASSGSATYLRCKSPPWTLSCGTCVSALVGPPPQTIRATLVCTHLGRVASKTVIVLIVVGHVSEAYEKKKPRKTKAKTTFRVYTTTPKVIPFVFAQWGNWKAENPSKRMDIPGSSVGPCMVYVLPEPVWP